MKYLYQGLLMSLLLLTVVGCKSKQVQSTQEISLMGTWELAEQSQLTNLEKAFPQGRPTLTFEKDKDWLVYGFDGCNKIRTTVSVKKKNQIKVDDKVAATMMACQQTKDFDFTTLFTSATRYSLSENVLILESDKGKLTFHRVALNGKWMLNKVFFGNIKAKDLYPYKKPFITIDINSTTMTGNTACNNVSGQILIYQNTMKFNHLLTTKMFCDGVNEKLFTDALARTTHYKLEGTRLTLLENQKPILELVRQFEN